MPHVRQIPSLVAAADSNQRVTDSPISKIPLDEQELVLSTIYLDHFIHKLSSTRRSLFRSPSIHRGPPTLALHLPLRLLLLTFPVQWAAIYEVAKWHLNVRSHPNEESRLSDLANKAVNWILRRLDIESRNLHLTLREVTDTRHIISKKGVVHLMFLCSSISMFLNLVRLSRVVKDP
jgi:hypothetical protein